jgi:hypothetical protein
MEGPSSTARFNAGGFAADGIIRGTPGKPCLEAGKLIIYLLLARSTMAVDGTAAHFSG